MVIVVKSVPTRLVISLRGFVCKCHEQNILWAHPLSSRYATRYVIVRVFPDPAPANTKHAPSPFKTTFNCSALSSLR